MKIADPLQSQRHVQKTQQVSAKVNKGKIRNMESQLYEES